jgi:tetratricopeptide (TPR) repeat protein
VLVSSLVASVSMTALDAAPGTASGTARGAGKRAPSTAAAAGAAARALDKPAFTATPGELLELARVAPTGTWSTAVLREQRDVSYDDRGRATIRWRFVYVVQSRNELDDHALATEWHPSYQDRPVIRARVIAPTGAVAELDPAKVIEPPVEPHAPPDHRELEAELPATPIGAVVEWEIATSDREPRPGGSVDTAVIGDPRPTASTVISYAGPAAASARIRVVERRLPPGTRTLHRVDNGREIWRYEIPALGAQHGESDVPGDVAVSSYVGATTTASWEAVARAYRKRLDQRLAEGPVELPAGLPRAASVEAVEAIAAWVHHHVELTDEGSDLAPGTPTPPAQTVKRGSGNGDDKAALLIALLRQAGIRAELALVDTDWQRHVDPDLPGLAMFGQSLVRARIGARDLWIDPTRDLAHPGQLPDRAQGRRALVIADDTRALSMTPLAAPADNTVHDVRTFTAAEQGPARVTQVVRSTGAFEAEDRSAARSIGRDKLDAGFGSRAERLFSGSLARATSSDPMDLSTPFELTLTVNDARRMVTSREQLEVILYPHAALEHLPWTVIAPSEAPRTSDFVWPRPQIYEVENRIVLPPGFAPPAALPERVRPLGTATFTERQRVDGQTLVVTYRFDSGKPRLTPTELAALQAAVKDLKDETVRIKVDHTSLVLAEAGKLREAIAECQRVIALHPTEALHHDQLATVLMRAGAGAAARREARKAAALRPRDADAQVVLGWTLTFDSFGRQYTHDWDRAGAIAALQLARKLDRTHPGASPELARVLERDPAGLPFTAGADLRGAAEAWRAALAIESNDESLLGLARVLVWSGQFAEAERVARSAEQTIDRDGWIVAAVAGGSGASAAIAAADDLRGGVERNGLLTTAAWTMLYQRRYEPARALFTEGGVPTVRWIADAVTTVTRQPALPVGAGEPRAAVLDALAALADPARKTAVFWDAEIERDFRAEADRFVASVLRGPDLAPLFGDFVQSVFTVEITGGAGLWRATVNDGRKFQLYLVLDRGAVKLLGATSLLDGVGRYVLRGDSRADPRMRTLLDWIRADHDKASGIALTWFKRLWGPGLPSSHDAIRLAGATLAGGSDADRVIAIATRCASNLPDAELTCHELLGVGYMAAERWIQAAEQLADVIQRRPDRAPTLVRMQAFCLGKAGRFDEAELLLDNFLANHVDVYEALVARFWVADARGDAAEALRRADAVAQHMFATPSALNEIAWYMMVRGADLPAALELARRGARFLPRAYDVANTVAAIEADMGALRDAVTDNWAAMALHGPAAADADWYVAARIYEQLGLTGDAIAAYKRIARPGGSPRSVTTLASDRLRALR